MLTKVVSFKDDRVDKIFFQYYIALNKISEVVSQNNQIIIHYYQSIESIPSLTWKVFICDHQTQILGLKQWKV